MDTPSKVTDRYWLTALYDEDVCTVYSGKWLIFVHISKVDELWNRIKEKTMEGKLGFGAKVATRKPSPLAKYPNIKVICVYTKDYRDEAEVMRVREELRNMGIAQKLAYKADADTRAGRYSDNGDKDLAKYYV